MSSLVEPEAANPDLEPGILLELAQGREGTKAGVDLLRQKLKLAAGEMPFGVPEQAIKVGELIGEFGLKPVELPAKLTVLIECHAELPPRVVDVVAYFLKLGPGLLPGPLDLDLGGGDQLFSGDVRV